MNREHRSTPKPVDQIAGITLNAKPGGLDKLRKKALFLGTFGKTIAPVKVKSEFKFSDGFFAKAALFEVGKAHGPTLVVVPHPLTELLERKGIDCKHALAPVANGFLLRACLFFFDFYAVLLGQPAQRVGVGQLLVLHQKSNYRAALSRRKTLKNALGRNHIKRRRLLLSKGTKAPEAAAAALKRCEFANNLLNARGVKNAVNSGRRNQSHRTDEGRNYLARWPTKSIKESSASRASLWANSDRMALAWSRKAFLRSQA